MNLKTSKWEADHGASVSAERDARALIDLDPEVEQDEKLAEIEFATAMCSLTILRSALPDLPGSSGHSDYCTPPLPLPLTTLEDGHPLSGVQACLPTLTLTNSGQQVCDRA